MNLRLPSSKYEEIKEIVVDLFEDFGISSIPINPANILQKMGFEVFSYDILSEYVKEIACRYSPDAFRCNAGLNRSKFVLYSPDRSKERTRFSLAHELGHIVLEHDSTKDPYQEAEANFFASYLLAPIPLVISVCESIDLFTVSVRFDISLEFASNVMSRCQSRMCCKYDVKEYESRLLKQFGFEADFFRNALC